MRWSLAKIYPLSPRSYHWLKPNFMINGTGDFEEFKQTDNPQSWSVHIELVEPSEDNMFFWGFVCFLVEEAPHEVMYPNREFFFMDITPALKVVITEILQDD